MINGLGNAISGTLPVANSVGQLALAIPNIGVGYQPVVIGATQNPPAYVFKTEGENTAESRSDITDHYAEDNTSLQDNIALPPPIVTVHGFEGELSDVLPPQLFQTAKVAAGLPLLADFAPPLSVTAQNAYNSAQEGYQLAASAAGSAVAAWSSLTSGSQETVVGSNGIPIGANGQPVVSPNQTQQQLAFQMFFAYQRAKILFTVPTPWAIFQNMAIELLKAVQDPTTRMITDFFITFKQMRFASTTVSVPNVAIGRAASQAAPPVSLGTTTPSPSISVATAMAGVN